ncbi:MAG: amino acid ABC transporter substrate-binding protein [Alphaproteobacteria bacterium]|nr:amino acid ABC transporter substrate-binding protein [Alphaproteobacteria bacterium]
MAIKRRTVITAATLALPAIRGASAQAAKTITFGGSIPLSGGAAETGLNVNNGYKTAVQFINEQGGVEIGGTRYKLDLKLFDDASDPSRAVNLIQRQLDDGVDFFLGSFGSNIVLPTAAVTERAEKPMVQAGGGSDQIFGQGYKYVFGMFPRATRQFRSTAAFIKTLMPPVQNYSVIFTNDAFSKTAAQGVMAAMKDQGIPMLESYSFPETITDASSVLASIRAKTPEALVCMTHDQDNLLIAKQMIATGTNVNLLFQGLGPQLGSFRETLGKSANGIYFQTYWDERAPLKDRFFGTPKDFAAYYRKNNSRPIAYHVSAGAACIVTYIEAMMAAKSIDPVKVRDALATIDVNTQYARIKFTEQGDGDPVIMGPWVGQVVGGAPEVIAPANAKTASYTYPTPPWSQRS